MCALVVHDSRDLPPRADDALVLREIKRSVCRRAFRGEGPALAPSRNSAIAGKEASIFSSAQASHLMWSNPLTGDFAVELPPRMISEAWLTGGVCAARSPAEPTWGRQMPARRCCSYISRAADWLAWAPADWKTCDPLEVTWTGDEDHHASFLRLVMVVVNVVMIRVGELVEDSPQMLRCDFIHVMGDSVLVGVLHRHGKSMEYLLLL